MRLTTGLFFALSIVFADGPAMAQSPPAAERPARGSASPSAGDGILLPHPLVGAGRSLLPKSAGVSDVAAPPGEIDALRAVFAADGLKICARTDFDVRAAMRAAEHGYWPTFVDFNPSKEDQYGRVLATGSSTIEINSQGGESRSALQLNLSSREERYEGVPASKSARCSLQIVLGSSEGAPKLDTTIAMVTQVFGSRLSGAPIEAPAAGDRRRVYWPLAPAPAAPQRTGNVIVESFGTSILVIVYFKEPL